MNKIAIIEDDIDICNMIAKFLENNKYIVHYALNGAEGIELCKSLVPDLIILDIMLPKLNGNDVLQRLRKFTNAPVIVVYPDNSIRIYECLDNVRILLVFSLFSSLALSTTSMWWGRNL